MGAGVVAVSSDVNRPGREADHYFNLVPKLRMCRDIPPLPFTSLGRNREKFIIGRTQKLFE